MLIWSSSAQIYVGIFSTLSSYVKLPHVLLCHLLSGSLTQSMLCFIAKNLNCSEENHWWLKAETEVWVRPEMCLFNCKSPVKSQLVSTCIECISGWGCVIQAGLYVQLLEPAAVLPSGAYEQYLLMVVWDYKKKVQVKCRMSGSKNEEKDKLQRDMKQKESGSKFSCRIACSSKRGNLFRA